MANCSPSPRLSYRQFCSDCGCWQSSRELTLSSSKLSLVKRLNRSLLKAHVASTNKVFYSEAAHQCRETPCPSQGVSESTLQFPQLGS